LQKGVAHPIGAGAGGYRVFKKFGKSNISRGDLFLLSYFLFFAEEAPSCDRVFRASFY
jgi:hypothetical protein